MVLKALVTCYQVHLFFNQLIVCLWVIELYVMLCVDNYRLKVLGAHHSAGAAAASRPAVAENTGIFHQSLTRRADAHSSGRLAIKLAQPFLSFPCVFPLQLAGVMNAAAVPGYMYVYGFFRFTLDNNEFISGKLQPGTEVRPADGTGEGAG